MTTTAPRPDEYVGEEMTLVEHLVELRTRLFRSALAIVGSFAVGFLFRNQVLEILKGPYCDLPAPLRDPAAVGGEQTCALYFSDPITPLFFSLKAAAVVMVVLSAPVVCYQIWRFITPGLRPVERRYSIPFVVLTQALFAGGAAFSYLLIPRALEFLLNFAGDELVPLLDADRYLTFVLQITVAFGIVFEFPLVLAILALMGVVTAAGLRKSRRYAIFGVFVGAAIITPTQDPLTMTFMAGPLIVFYEFSILFAWYVERRRARSGGAEDLEGMGTS